MKMKARTKSKTPLLPATKEEAGASPAAMTGSQRAPSGCPCRSSATRWSPCTSRTRRSRRCRPGWRPPGPPACGRSCGSRSRRCACRTWCSPARGRAQARPAVRRALPTSAFRAALRARRRCRAAAHCPASSKGAAFNLYMENRFTTPHVFMLMSWLCVSPCSTAVMQKHAQMSRNCSQHTPRQSIATDTTVGGTHRHLVRAAREHHRAHAVPVPTLTNQTFSCAWRTHSPAARPLNTVRRHLCEQPRRPASAVHSKQPGVFSAQRACGGRAARAA
jgi:hypothetical protein